MVEKELLDKVKSELTRYLETNTKYRKTQERYAILEQIYTTEGHFDVESLLKSMTEEKNYRISRATMYNTINLFVDARLVSKFQFGNNTAQYERTYGMDGHHHLICTACGDVRDIKDKVIKGVMKNMQFSRFTWDYYAFYIYGMCSKCSIKRQKEERLIETKSEKVVETEKTERKK